MKQSREAETDQREAVMLSPRPSPTQRTTVYQLSPCPKQDPMGGVARTGRVSVAVEAVGNVWLPREVGWRRGDSLPVIEGKPQQTWTGNPVGAGGAEPRGRRLVRGCHSDSFLFSRVEPLTDAGFTGDGIGTGAEARALVPAKDPRRPSTPIVATGVPRQVRRQRILSTTDARPTPTPPPPPTTTVRVSGESRASPDRRRRRSSGGLKSPDPPLKKPPSRSEASSRPPTNKKDTPATQQPGDRGTEGDAASGAFCIWRERSQSLRRVGEAAVPSDASRAGDRSKDGSAHRDHDASAKNQTQNHIVLTHLNYCSSRKTNQVVHWLQEVNLQNSFEIIE